MKSLFFPAIILAVLIALFGIVGCNEFNRNDDVQTVQSERQGARSNPVSNSTELKHASEVETAAGDVLDSETISAAEAQSAQSKPVEGATPANAFSKDNSISALSDRRIDAATTTESKPTAIPVVTAEEAEKLNAKADEDWSDFQKRRKDKTILEGKVLTLSQCPDPSSIDYPDCNLSATILLNDIAQTRICLIIPCIRDSKVVFPETIQAGSLISFQLRNEDTLSEHERSIQLVEDDSNFDLDYCYTDQIREITRYAKTSRYAKEKTKEIIYDKSIALTKKDLETRKKFMDSELERLDEIISNYSAEDAKEFYGNFSDLTKDIKDTHIYAEIEYEDKSKKIFPVEIQFSVEQFLNSALSNDRDLMIHNAQVIASVNEYLKERGILLLVVPVPLPFESYAQLFAMSKELSTYNINRVMYMQQLLEQGVEVLDIEPMIEKSLLSPYHYFLLFKKDFHLSEMGAYRLAKHIYDHLDQYEFLRPLIKNDYSIEIVPKNEKVNFNGKHFRDMESISIVTELDPVDKQSPFLLVGDSFSYRSHIQDYLAYFFKSKINVISRGSSSADTAQLLQMRSSEISPNTKVCFLVNTSYHLNLSFKPFYDDGGIQIFPSASTQELNLYMKSKDLLNEPFSFDLILPDSIDLQKKYALRFFTHSDNKKITYSIGIDSFQQKTFRGEHSRIERPLPANKAHVTVHCSASAPDGFLCKDDSFLEITRIMLIEN